MITPFEFFYNLYGDSMADELSCLDGNVESTTLRKCLIICWNQALDAAMQYNAVNLEKIREKE